MNYRYSNSTSQKGPEPQKVNHDPQTKKKVTFAKEDKLREIYIIGNEWTKRKKERYV